MNWVLAPYRDPQTFRTATYLALGLVMGVFDFVVIVTGLSLGIGLAITIIGIPVLIATLAVARSLATLERGLARSLLDAPLPLRRQDVIPGEAGLLGRLRYLARSRRTWSEVLFLILRLPLGVLDFVVVTVVFGLAFGGLVYPWLVVFGVEGSVGDWVIDTLPESLFLLPVSILFMITGGRLITAWGEVSRRIVARLLGWVDLEEVSREVADVVVRRGEADAFEIYNDVSLRLGAGPFLSPIRVQAALLALEETGHVAAAAVGPRIVYRAA